MNASYIKSNLTYNQLSFLLKTDFFLIFDLICFLNTGVGRGTPADIWNMIRALILRDKTKMFAAAGFTK